MSDLPLFLPNLELIGDRRRMLHDPDEGGPWQP